ncbi:MAG: ABC transporter substrate-binding protein, partial [Thermomicrobiales bacterium]
GSTGTDPSQVIGSGPFRFVEWIAADHATMERWPDYWVPEMLPTIDRGTYRVVPDAATAIQTLKTAESDIVNVPPQQISDFEGNPNVTVARYDEWSWVAFCPNLNPASGTFFLQKDVRQAMMYALDRESMVSSILAGNATVAEGMQPLPSRAYAPDKLSTHYTFDVEKAKSLLDAAGWVDSDGDGIREKDGKKFSTELLFRDTGGTSAQVVTYLQQAWKAVGLDIAPRSTEGPAFSEAVITSGKFELALIGISWTDEDQSVLYRADSWPEKGGFNLSRYSNPDYDKLNTAQLTEFDVAKRMAIIEASDNILNDDVAVGVMYFTKGAVGYQNRLQNFTPNAYGSFWQMPFVWLKQ